jgi:hypothetical protein
VDKRLSAPASTIQGPSYLFIHKTYPAMADGVDTGAPYPLPRVTIKFCTQ